MHEAITREERVYDGRVVHLVVLDVTLPDGKTARRELVRHPGAVAVVPLIGEDVLLVRQYRTAASQVMLEIPAGTLNPGEGIALAAAAFPATATGKSSNTLPSIVHAVVDPFVTSVASTEYFLGIIAGLCKFKNEESGTITALDKIMPGGTTAGRFTTISTTPGTATIARNEAVSMCGQAIETSAVAGALVLGMKFRQLW